MRPLTVAIIAVAGFSPFHLSVPFIVFSEKWRKTLSRDYLR